MKRALIRSAFLAGAALTPLWAFADDATNKTGVAVADSGSSIETVVVTARRVEERAGDVPISLSVLSGESLARSGGYALDDIQHQVPSLVAFDINPRNSSVGIRGEGKSDAAIGDALTEELQTFAGDPNVRVVVITGGAPGYFNRHFDIPALIDIAESIRASGRQWPDNASYHGGFFDKAAALCETMPKPVIAAISGTALAGAFEFTLACDIRIAEDGDY